MPDDGRELLVPDLGEGLEEATIVRWLAAIGADVALNQPLCVVETAKAEVEIPSPFAGRLLEHGGGEGDTLAVGTLLARIRPADDAESAEPDTGVETAATGPERGRAAVLVGTGPTPATTAAAARGRHTVGPWEWVRRASRPTPIRPAAAGRWPSRRSASWPGRWASTSLPSPPGRDRVAS